MALRQNVFLAGVLALSIISFHISDATLNTELFSGHYDFLDLSHTFDEQTVYWPGGKRFEFTKKTEKYLGENKTWYAANEFAAAEHGGTHLDAPYHFYRTGKHVGDIPLTDLILPLIIADVSSIVNDDPNFVLHKHDLDYILNNNLGKPCVLIFKFGWSKFYQTEKYLGINEQTKTLNFPSISAEVAEWITTSYKNIVGVGVDVASVDPGSSTDLPVHQIFAAAGLYCMENVNLSSAVPDNGCTALVMPMKLRKGTGAPLRLVAICPKQIPSTF